MTAHSDPFMLLDQAKSVLLCQNDRPASIALGLKAIKAFEAQDLLNRESARNAILKLGVVDVIDAYVEASGSVISWKGTTSWASPEALNAILLADGTDFLNAMLAHKCPILIIKKQILAVAIKRQDIELFDWLCQTMIGRGGARSVLSWMLNLVTDCPAKMAPGLAQTLKACMPHCQDRVYEHTVAVHEQHGRKIAAILINCEVSAQILLRILENTTLPDEICQILRTGTSHHGRLQAFTSEPSLTDIILRPPHGSFYGCNEMSAAT